MTGSRPLGRSDARKRAGALAALVRAEAGRLADDRAAGSWRRLQAAVDQLDRALAFGLAFQLPPDAGLARRRGHARNVALAIRRAVGLARAPALDPASRRHWLGQAAQHADELIATVGWIQRRIQAVEAAALPDGWSATCTGQLLGLAAHLLPEGARREFVEDHCANLELIESRREWLRYLLGLLASMPAIAAAALAARGPTPDPDQSGP